MGIDAMGIAANWSVGKSFNRPSEHNAKYGYQRRYSSVF